MKVNIRTLLPDWTAKQSSNKPITSTDFIKLQEILIQAIEAIQDEVEKGEIRPLVAAGGIIIDNSGDELILRVPKQTEILGITRDSKFVSEDTITFPITLTDGTFLQQEDVTRLQILIVSNQSYSGQQFAWDGAKWIKLDNTDVSNFLTKLQAAQTYLTNVKASELYATNDYIQTIALEISGTIDELVTALEGKVNTTEPQLSGIEKDVVSNINLRAFEERSAYKSIPAGTIKTQIARLVDWVESVEKTANAALTTDNSKDLTDNLSIPTTLPVTDAKIATRGAVRAVEARNLAKYDAVNDELVKIKALAESSLASENATLVEGMTTTNKSHSVGTWIPQFDSSYEIYNDVDRYLADGSENPEWAAKPNWQKYKAKSFSDATNSRIEIYKIGSWKGTINGNVTRLTAGQVVTVKARIKAFTKTEAGVETEIVSARTEIFGAAGITLNDQYFTHALVFNRPFTVTTASINANSIASVLKFEIEVTGGDVRLSSGFQWIVEEDQSKAVNVAGNTEALPAKDAAAEGGANQKLINVANKAVKDATVGISRDVSKGHTIIDTVDFTQRSTVWDNAATRVAAVNSKQVAYLDANGDEAHRTLAEINVAGDTTDKTKTIASVQFVEENMNKVGDKLKLDPTKLMAAEAKLGITHS